MLSEDEESSRTIASRMDKISVPVLPLRSRVSIRSRDIITNESVDESVVLMLNLVWGSEYHEPHEDYPQAAIAFRVSFLTDWFTNRPTDSPPSITRVREVTKAVTSLTV